MIILFLNHKVKSCGVYQYGLRLFDILKQSTVNSYIYKEIENYDEYIETINNITPRVIIYNFHIFTMAWLNDSNLYKYCKNIGILHETKTQMFDLLFNIDPDAIESYNEHNIPRPIFENVETIIQNYSIENSEIKKFIEYNEGPNIPIFGSFGFGFQNKGFDKIVKYVNEQYDNAIIKLLITFAYFDPNRDSNINTVMYMCNSIKIKPGIKLLISNEFFSNEEILMFLSNNTCNIFLYDNMESRGVSSTIDYAISVKKPIVISDSYMFRNIYSDKICIYKTDIKTAIENSKQIVNNYIDIYSNANLINKVDSTITNFANNVLGFELSAYYHTNNYTESSNVTEQILQSFLEFTRNGSIEIPVNNSFFKDTAYGQIKYLFINLKKNDYNIELKQVEGVSISWNNIISIMNNHLSGDNTHQTENSIEVSIGEIIDKYSILELKQKYITDEIKLKDIKYEMSKLEKNVSSPKTSHFYKILLYINDLIWKNTDIIKSIDIENTTNQETIKTFSNISNSIFIDNQKRFRIKNYFNNNYSSSIKEHKSYNQTKCFINVIDESYIYDKIPEINYLYISYDSIYFKTNYTNIITNFFGKNSGIRFIKDTSYINENYNTIQLSDYSISNNLKDTFDFEPIKYKGAGKMGDYLNQLSVICEKYYETGRKGILYIYNLPTDGFVFGTEYAYKDTYSIITSQPYIKDYKIYNDEVVDINLSSWRHDLGHIINLYKNHNWNIIYNYVYGIDWGKHQWIKTNTDKKWENKIIINNPFYRGLSHTTINNIRNIILENKDNCIFIANEIEHYLYFCSEIDINIDFYRPNSFYETCVIINSCKYGLFGFSSFAVIANGLYKQHYLFGKDDENYYVNRIKEYMPHVVDIFI